MSAKDAYNESLKSQDRKSHKWYEATRDTINREINRACKEGQFEAYVEYPREMNVKYRDKLIAELQNDGYKVNLSDANGGLIRRFHITWREV